MHTVVDDKNYSYYVYDHSGERRIKLTGDSELLDVNAESMYPSALLRNTTLYPSSFMVLTQRGYTKHYYAGTERVAARIGGGGLSELYPVTSNDTILQITADSLFEQAFTQVNHRVMNANKPDCFNNDSFTADGFSLDISDIPYQVKAKVLVDNELFYRMIDDMSLNSTLEKELDVYFYHSDHLGSASWITNQTGNAVQHLQYLPFGERYIDQRIAGYQERFTFSGKERDEETGFGYFGARYYDSELLTGWLSVDPMMDKYPSISGYAYCVNNPVILIDPDGNSPIKGITSAIKIAKKHTTSIRRQES